MIISIEAKKKTILNKTLPFHDKDFQWTRKREISQPDNSIYQKKKNPSIIIIGESFPLTLGTTIKLCSHHFYSTLFKRSWLRKLARKSKRHPETNKI